MTFPHTPEPYVIFVLAIIVPVLLVWVHGLGRRVRALETQNHNAAMKQFLKVE